MLKSKDLKMTTTVYNRSSELTGQLKWASSKKTTMTQWPNWRRTLNREGKRCKQSSTKKTVSSNNRRETTAPTWTDCRKKQMTRLDKRISRAMLRLWSYNLSWACWSRLRKSVLMSWMLSGKSWEKLKTTLLLSEMLRSRACSLSWREWLWREMSLRLSWVCCVTSSCSLRKRLKESIELDMSKWSCRRGWMKLQLTFLSCRKKSISQSASHWNCWLS